ncbi:MAG: ATP-dependent Clp protease adapter ClpS [Thiotrichaceae bacterium]|nr:ATP-dependent Clp protease adapter ClpS [Thiotrichaceae bacterium]
MAEDTDQQGNIGHAVEKSRPEVKEPKQYKVILLNDDYTPMDFVIEVLRIFFSLTEESATRVMLSVHTKGKGICGTYTREIAETKVVQVNQFSEENGHPLKCDMEKSS